CDCDNECSCLGPRNAGVFLPARAFRAQRRLVVESNFIHQFAGLLAVLGYFGKRQRVDDQLAETGDDRVKLYALLYGVLVIGICIKTLCLVRNQILEQLYGIFFIWCMLGHGSAGDINMGAAALFVGKGGANNFDGIAPFSSVGAGFGVFHAAHVVGVC